jgi:hypothetical protein
MSISSSAARGHRLPGRRYPRGSRPAQGEAGKGYGDIRRGDPGDLGGDEGVCPRRSERSGAQAGGPGLERETGHGDCMVLLPFGGVDPVIIKALRNDAGRVSKRRVVSVGSPTDPLRSGRRSAARWPVGGWGFHPGSTASRSF